MTITKTQRWLDLIAFLVRHRLPVDIEAIMAAVPAYRRKLAEGTARAEEAARRMFERDKAELRDAGFPLETREYTIDHGAETRLGYQLAGRDFYLPYLRLVGAGREGDPPPGAGQPRGVDTLQITGEEAWTAIEALRRVAAQPANPFADDARAALRKLSFDLDLDAIGESPVRYAPEDTDIASRMAPAGELHRIREVARGPRDDLRVTLDALSQALRARRRVRFRYHGIYRGEPTDRDVDPYGLLYQHGHWYLIGHDHTRDAVRVFRVGRMEAPEVGAGDAPDFQPPAGFRLADYAAREPWELGDDEPAPATVRFEFPLALWADRNERGEKIDELPGGAQLRRFRVRQPDPFLRWLQQFGGDAVVTDPPAFRDAQRRLARETLATYGDDG